MAIEPAPQFHELYHATDQRFKYGDIVEPRSTGATGEPTAYAGHPNDARFFAKWINEQGSTGTGTSSNGRKARVYKVVPVDPEEATKSPDTTYVRSKKGFRVVKRARRLE